MGRERRNLTSMISSWWFHNNSLCCSCNIVEDNLQNRIWMVPKSVMKNLEKGRRNQAYVSVRLQRKNSLHARRWRQPLCQFQQKQKLTWQVTKYSEVLNASSIARECSRIQSGEKSHFVFQMKDKSELTDQGYSEWTSSASCKDVTISGYQKQYSDSIIKI
jgi:hypothetical protein